MPLWGSNDDSANSTIFAASQVHKTPNTVNQTALFDNLTPDDFITGVTVGQFGIDVSEQQQSSASATERPAHAGWVLRTEGSGGRASRVHYETLVAMGSLGGDASNTVLPQQAIVISSQPVATSANSTAGQHAYFSVTASLVPSGGSITYAWQANGSTISNGSVYANTGTATLDVKDATGLGNTYYRVALSKAGATTVYSANVKLTEIT